MKMPSLKIAIILTGKSQRQVATETRIHENRLSKLCCGWAEPTTTERLALEKALGETLASGRQLSGDAA